jgi:hypothetical protein
MGMYNEVFKQCPECGRRCYQQIPQVVLGFGGFDLDRPSSMEDLTVEERGHLSEILNSENYKKFYCNGDKDFSTVKNEGCGHSFTVHISVKPRLSDIEIEI